MRNHHRAASSLSSSSSWATFLAVVVVVCRSSFAYDTTHLDDNSLNVLDKKLKYGDGDIGTAYPNKDPLPRISVILQYFKMAPNIDPLSKWKDCPGVEFIVNVDSDQIELDKKWLTKDADHVVFSKNIHETRAYNKLARVSRAPITFFVQDDEPPPSDCRYIDHVEKMFEDDPKLAVVGFAVGTNTPWGHSWRTPDGEVVEHIRTHAATHKWGLGNIAAEYAACVDIGPFVVRRRDFLAMGGFDESFSYPGKGAVGLDFDVATRAWLSGHTVAKYDQEKSGVGKVKGIVYPSGEGGLRKKAEYWDKDSVERGARQKAFARYEEYYDQIAALVVRKNQGLKPWGPEEVEATRREAEAEAKKAAAEKARATETETETEEKAGEKAPPLESGNSDPREQRGEDGDAE